MSGGVPNNSDEKQGFAPDEADADLIEMGIKCMLWEKNLHYWLIRYLYLGDARSTVEGANYFNKSQWWVRNRHHEAVGYLLRKCQKGKSDLKSTA